MTRRLQVLLVAALLATSGCGNGTLSEEAAADLQQRADAIRAAAEARDVDAAEEALTGLRTALESHAEADAVSPGRAREIATAADAVEARLSLLVEEEVEEVPPAEEAPPTTEPPPPPSSTTTIPEPEPDEDKDKDKDDDKDDEGDGDDQDGSEDGRGPDGDGPPGQSRGASAVEAIGSSRAG